MHQTIDRADAISRIAEELRFASFVTWQATMDGRQRYGVITDRSPVDIKVHSGDGPIRITFSEALSWGLRSITPDNLVQTADLLSLRAHYCDKDHVPLFDCIRRVFLRTE